MSRNSVFEQVRGRWQALLAALGVDPSFLTGRHVPCPICGGTDRFRFDNRSGFGTWICNQCGAGGPLKLLDKLFGWGPAEVAKRLEQVLHVAPAAEAMHPANEAVVATVVANAKAMEAKWHGAKPVARDGPVWHYLRSRGISYRSDVVLREEVGCCRFEMLARVQRHDDVPCQVHRTLVLPDGVERYFMRGPHPPGSAVRLMPWDITGTLGIAEGIETALSAAECYGVPCWAALNAGRLKAWVPPENCGDVLIFADHDPNGVGKDAAVALARRIHNGRRVRIFMPTTPTFDYNDCLLEVRSGGVISKFGIVH